MFKLFNKKKERVYKGFKHSCWECKHSIGFRSKGCRQTFWDPGEDPCIEGCGADMPEGYYDHLMDRYDKDYSKWLFSQGLLNKLFIINKFITNRQLETVEDYIGKRCIYFLPGIYSCSICDKLFSAGKGYMVNGEYEFLQVCSKVCGEAEVARLDKYYENERQMEEEYDSYLEKKMKEVTDEEIRELDKYISSGRADEDYDRYKDHNREVLRRNNL